MDKVQYTTLAQAQSVCSEKPTCRGITLTGGVYRLNTVDYVEYSASSTVYLRGGPVADEVTYEVSYRNHVWTVESPFQIEGSLADGRRYRKYSQALKVSGHFSVSIVSHIFIILISRTLKLWKISC